MEVTTPFTTEDARMGTEAPTVITIPVHCAPELVRALEQLSEERFAKIMAYLRGPAGRRVLKNISKPRSD
jgi:hypothetical protein